MFRREHTSLLILVILVALSTPLAAYTNGLADPASYNPPTNIPEGPPPNFNQIDSSYFLGGPDFGAYTPSELGGYHIFKDTEQNRWYVAGVVWPGGALYEQMHGSILVQMDNTPEEGVNVWPLGFYKTGDLVKNDRWGWVKWPEEIAPNLYEIWWDVTIDWARLENVGDPYDTVGISFDGCAFDFNVWASGHFGPFTPNQILIGPDMIPITDIPGYADTYAGVEDQYQGSTSPYAPNTTIFTARDLPGSSFNADGPISGDTQYDQTYGGSFTYEGNGLQFSINTCPPSNEIPGFNPPLGYTRAWHMCPGSDIVEMITGIDPDPDDILTIEILSGPGTLEMTPGTSPLDAIYSYTPPAPGEYTVVFKISDDEGASYVDSVTHEVIFNSPPVLSVENTSLALCDPYGQVCYTVPAEDAEGDPLTFDLISGPGSIDPVTGELCFTPAGTGDYDFEVAVSDSCGRTTAPFSIAVNVNSTPSINGFDSVITLCDVEEVCFDVTASDPNPNDYLIISPVSGPGSFEATGNGTGTQCFMPDAVDSATYVFYFDVTDDCLRGDGPIKTPPPTPADSITITVLIDHPPVITCPPNDIVFQCTPEEICAQVSATDADNDVVVFSLIDGPGTIDPETGEVCFTPNGEGTYTLTVAATDECGKSDTCSFSITVYLNQAPEITIRDTSVFLCEPSDICIPVTIDDDDGNIVEVTVENGSYDSQTGMACLTGISASGTYAVNVTVRDECGATTSAQGLIVVSMNSAPVVELPYDTTISLCGPDLICLEGFSFTDADDNIASIEYTPPPYDDKTIPYCFQADTAGTYCIIAKVTDECGAYDIDTICVTVEFGSNVSIDCPVGTQFITLCTPQEVCLDLGISPSGASVSVEGGAEYRNGQLCFTPDQSGVYIFNVTATGDCGTANCEVAVDVLIGEAPVVTCPEDQTINLCGPGMVSIPFDVATAGAEVTVSPDGEYVDGAIQFMADQAGDYCFTVDVSTECGTASCEFCVTVIFNSDPSVEIADIDDTLCNVQEVCLPVTVSDPDNNITSVAVEPAGYEIVDGAICFTPEESGLYEFTVTVTDECGVIISETGTARITINRAPQVTINDSTVFLCQAGQVCIPVTYFDPDGDALSITVSEPAVYDTETGMVCITPDGSGEYPVAFTVTDGCGAEATGHAVITVVQNTAPIVTVPNDTTVFQCTPAEICLSGFSIADNENNIVSTVVEPAIGVYQDGTFCFTPDTAGVYCFTMTVTDECDITTTGQFCVTYDASTDVAIDCPDGPQMVQICGPETICIPIAVEPSDATVMVLDDLARYENGQLCYDATGPGIVNLTVVAVGECGEDTCGVTLNISQGETPHVTCPPSETIHLCGPDMITLPLGIMPSNANVTITPDAELTDGMVRFYADRAGEYCFTVEAETGCGTDECQFCITVVFDSPPFVNIADSTVALCDPSDEICLPLTFGDPDDNIASITVQSQKYTVYDGRICFIPDEGSGEYEIIVTVTDSCGNAAIDTAMVDVSINEAPQITARDTTAFLCEPGDVCIPIEVIDGDGFIEDVTVSEPAVYNPESKTVCIPFEESGEYQIVITAVDDCGAETTSTITIGAEVNKAPTVTVPKDTLVVSCTADEICLTGFVFADEDDNISSIEFTQGIGSYTDGTYCFTPDTAGIYCITAVATDECGESTQATVCITYQVGEDIVISCPEDVAVFNICEVQPLCIPVPIEPTDATVTFLEAGATYTDGEVCITPEESGVYTYTMIASGECTADTCSVTFDVTIGVKPVLSCPGDQTIHLCAPDMISIPLGVIPPDAEVTIEPEAAFENGVLTFSAETSGEYCFTVIAANSCGADTCDFCITVEIDSAPTVAMNDTTIFQCLPEEICIPVQIGDIDDNINSMVIEPAELELVDGFICFTPDTAGTYDIIMTVSDTCENVVADTAHVVVTLNQPPVVDIPDSSIFLCEPSLICLPVTAYDDDGQISSIEVDEPAYYDPELEEICLMVSNTGAVTITVTVTDDCGEKTSDIATIDVTINSAPEISFGDFENPIYLCDISEVCIPVSALDIDGNIAEIRGEGSCADQITFDDVDSTLCWLPNIIGTCELVVIVTDDCGEADTASIEVTIQQAEQPNPQCPGDTTVIACEPGLHCIWVGPLGHNVTVHPNDFHYDPQNGTLCYEVQDDRVDVVTVIDSTYCGIDSCSFELTTVLNTEPVIIVDDSVNGQFCEPFTMCIGVHISDPENNLAETKIIGDCPGAFFDKMRGQICLDIFENVDCKLGIVALDSCGAADTVYVPINLEMNNPPSISLPEMDIVVRCLSDTDPIVISNICVEDADPDDDVSLIMRQGNGDLDYDPATRCATLTFMPPSSDSAEYCFDFMAADSCDTALEQYCLTVVPSPVCSTCVDVSIVGPDCVTVGAITTVDIVAESFSEIAAYDLLIAYDGTVLNFLAANLGPTVRDWEYFTYRYGPDGNCEGNCPSGIVRLFAIADANNDPTSHPPEEQLLPQGTIATMTFQVYNNQNFGGLSIPISFFWFDCGDNTLSDPSGEYLLLDQAVYGPEGALRWDERDDVRYPEDSRIPNLGAPDDCLVGDKAVPVRCATFHNGELCILHPDEIDARGDVNLNGISYEIADAVVFTNYFLRGLSAFTKSIPGQTAATDINGDGTTLSIADLVFLIRIITGDALPFPKAAPEDNGIAATLVRNGNEIGASINSRFDIGAALMIFTYDGERPSDPILSDDATGMDMEYAWTDDNTLRVLVYSMTPGMRVGSGNQDILHFTADEHTTVSLVEVDAADYYGMALSVSVNQTAIPKTLELSQNCPNPFNPTTTFELALPQASQYEVVIYNITGQRIRTWSGYAEAGFIKFEWDGTDEDGATVASGVYFYRARAAESEAMKKMVLLK